jgi:ubiquinone/menaquinone biosynthesis C-methylase UbiE
MTNVSDERSGQTAKIWDRFAKGYAEKPIDDQEAYEKKLSITQKYLKKDMEVLEYGCGTGGTSIIHAPFVKHILATDISGKMLEAAHKRLEESQVKNVEFQQVSIDQLQVKDESRDAVLGLSILHLLKNRDEVIAKTHKWLKPGGLFVTSTTCIGDLGASPFLKRILPLGNFFGAIPYVDAGITKEELRESLIKHKFSIEYEWQPKEDAAVFIIARKTV